jgi:farnesyl-diphosphate farnesyltransferase
MRNSARAYLLGPLLKGVSRSFYLTLAVLPKGMREPVGLGYLLARAADTIADTTLISPERRLALLLALREQVNGAAGGEVLVTQLASEVAAQQTQSDERLLLESVGGALTVLKALDQADREAVRAIVTTLSTGMEFDLRTFGDEQSGTLVALREWEELDRYTYLVAGCVGEFWTKMTYAHVPRALRGNADEIIERGVRFGKALQLTNVLRDCAKDLRIGRCYLPTEMLAWYGLRPEELLAPDASARSRALLFALVGRTLERYRDALAYTLAIRATSIRLRLACIWPIAIGIETLRLLIDNETWLDPARVSKVRRGDVYRIMARSLVCVASDGLLRRWIESLLHEVETRLAAVPANMRQA